jgi:hypothetical protein
MEDELKKVSNEELLKIYSLIESEIDSINDTIKQVEESENAG